MTEHKTYSGCVCENVARVVSYILLNCFICTYIAGNVLVNLIKTVGYRARLFRKLMLNITTFANNFDFI